MRMPRVSAEIPNLKKLAKTADYASRDIKSMPADASIQEAGKLARFSVGSLLLVRDGAYVGLVTDTDLARIAAARGLDPVTEPVSSVMSREIASIEGHRSMEEAQTFMKSRGVRHLVVLDQGKITGIVTLSDVIRYYQSVAMPLR
jgi:predicted transcriptional regulator